MRVDRGNRRGHGRHGFERIAAFGEDRPAGLYSREMRRTDGPIPVPGGMQVHRICHCLSHCSFGRGKAAFAQQRVGGRQAAPEGFVSLGRILPPPGGVDAIA